MTPRNRSTALSSTTPLTRMWSMIPNNKRFTNDDNNDDAMMQTSSTTDLAAHEGLRVRHLQSLFSSLTLRHRHSPPALRSPALLCSGSEPAAGWTGAAPPLKGRGGCRRIRIPEAGAPNGVDHPSSTPRPNKTRRFEVNNNMK